MSSWFVYMVRCADGSLYTGISTDLGRRVQQHNDGKGSAYTKSHGPVELVWSEQAKSESAARKCEAQIKGWTRKMKFAFIASKKSAILSASPKN